MIQKILIADDNYELLSGFSELLGEHGFKVWTACDFEQIERLFFKEQPDLLILDIMFGTQTTGPDFYKQVVKEGRLPKVPVIFISGLIDSRTEEPFVRGSETAMYAKPFNMSRLVQDIRAASSDLSTHAA